MAEDTIQLHRENQQKLFRLNERVASVEENLVKLQTAFADHKEVTYQIKKDTSEIVEFFQNAKQSAKFIIFAGKFAKWITALIAGSAVIYTAWASIRNILANMFHLH